MNLQKNLENINLTIKGKDLINVVNYCIQKTRDELEQTLRESNKEEYLSPQKVSELLDVHNTTLWRWAKKGYLKRYDIGGQIRYKMSEINALLERSKND
ncbi:helix-turn-helix domain-containing protein [Parabacteroides sp. OttesenSCG-928-G21]|nr:helix-turn-helix domain-containing protein [Parabacteroides sp. OttesenSCG-928-G21]